MGTPGIYEITNMVTGESYIGMTQDMPSRWDSHKASLRKGNHPNQALQQAWNDNGGESFDFTVLEIVADVSKLYVRERAQFRERYNRTGSDGYNHPRTTGKIARDHALQHDVQRCQFIESQQAQILSDVNDLLGNELSVQSLSHAAVRSRAVFCESFQGKLPFPLDPYLFVTQFVLEYVKQITPALADALGVSVKDLWDDNPPATS